MKHIYTFFFSILISNIVLAQPANDDCANAELITVSTALSSFTFEIIDATVNNEEGCDTALNDYVDVWYEFTMPVNGNLFIDGVTSWNNFGLYDACNGNLIQCGANDEFIDGLTSGTNYKLRVFRTVSLADNGFTSFGLRAFEEVTNDTCVTAETITVTTTEITSYDFDIGGAEVLNEEGCNAALSDYVDVWYEFTMPVNGNLFINGVTSWNNFGLYDACNGNLIQCGAGDEFIDGLTSGTTYTLRVFRAVSLADNSFTSFGLRAFEEVANDTCATAETITVTATEATSYDFDIGGAEVLNEEGCDTALSDYVDVWYEFTMPVNGSLFIAGVTSWNNFGLFDACNGNLIQCGTGDELIAGLTNGTNYKLRVFRTISLADNDFTSFGIRAFEEVANDTCATAETITVTATEATSYDFDIGGAEINNEEGCNTALSDYVDVWYEFTMPVNGNLFITGVTSWNNFGLYDACNGNLIQCGPGDELIEGLTNGTNYKLRVFRTTSLADNGFTSFGIQAFEVVPNDTCDNAETITVTTTEETTYNFTISGAEVNNEEGCDAALNDYVDVWYEFTMPVNGNLYINGVTSWNNFGLYDACNGNLIQCGENNEFIEGLTNSTTYKLRVFRTISLADNGFTSFGLRAFEEASNDTCNTAETITVTTDITTIDFEIGGASVANEEGCINGMTEDYVDIWYNFLMIEDGDIEIDGNTIWNNFTVFDSCNGTPLGCFEESGTVPNLSANTTYWIRVFRPLGLADNTSNLSFNILVTNTLGNNTFSYEAVKIFPNPTRDFIQISSNQDVNTLELYNIQGKKVIATKNQSQVSIKHLTSGVYFLKVYSEQGTITKKIIKQ